MWFKTRISLLNKLQGILTALSSNPLDQKKDTFTFLLKKWDKSWYWLPVWNGPIIWIWNVGQYFWSYWFCPSTFFLLALQFSCKLMDGGRKNKTSKQVIKNKTQQASRHVDIVCGNVIHYRYPLLSSATFNRVGLTIQLLEMQVEPPSQSFAIHLRKAKRLGFLCRKIYWKQYVRVMKISAIG